MAIAFIANASYLDHLAEAYPEAGPSLLREIEACKAPSYYTTSAKRLGIDLSAYAALFNLQKLIWAGEWDDIERMVREIPVLPQSLGKADRIESLVIGHLRLLNENKMAAELEKETGAPRPLLVKAILFLSKLYEGSFLVRSEDVKVLLARIPPPPNKHLAEGRLFLNVTPKSLNGRDSLKKLIELVRSVPRASVMRFTPKNNFERFSLVLWGGTQFSEVQWQRVVPTPPPKVYSGGGGDGGGRWITAGVVLITVLIMAGLYIYNRVVGGGVVGPTIRPALPKFRSTAVSTLVIPNDGKSALYHGQG